MNGGGGANDLVGIGRTPVVELRGLIHRPGVRLFAKLEGNNPTGSVKDRVAMALLSEADRVGALEAGQTVLEPTSGNTGISLAMVCQRRGLPFVAVMPENVTSERTALLRRYGAQIVHSEAAKGSNGAIELALSLAEADPRYYMPFQHANPANPRAHYDGTGLEILEQCGPVAAFVAGLGTGGTLTGVARRLKEHNPATVVVGVERPPGEPLPGLRSLAEGYVPPVLDLALIDRRPVVGYADAFAWTRRLFAAGLFTGLSAGAIASVAVDTARTLEQGDVVFIVPDDGWRYMSTGVFGEGKATAEPEPEAIS